MRPTSAPDGRAAHWLDRLGPLALAATGVAGLGVAVLPQHAGTIGRLLAGTFALGAALVAMVGMAPPPAVGRPALGPSAITRGATGRRPTALERPPSSPVPAIGAPGLSAARRSLTGLTNPARPASPARPARPATGLALTPAAWERLAVVAVAGFARRGIDVDNPATRDAARATVSPEVWRALVTPPAPPTRLASAPADPRAVAAAVERVLDELGQPGPPPPAPDPT